MTETDFLYVHRFRRLKNNIYISATYLFYFVIIRYFICWDLLSIRTS